MIKGQNMGIDSGLKGEVALARKEGLTPPHMPCPCRFPFLHAERASWAVADGRTEQFWAGRNRWDGHWGGGSGKRAFSQPGGRDAWGASQVPPALPHGLWVRMMQLWGPRKGSWTAVCVPWHTIPRHHAPLGTVGSPGLF